MSKRMPLKMLSLLLALGLCANLVSQIGTISHAQQSGSGFDRTQLSNDSPVGDLTEAFPQTGEVDVMIELFDAPTARVYAQTLGNSRNSNPQQLAQARGAARAQLAKIQGAQQRVLAHLGGHGPKAKVLYSVQSAYNGIAAKIDAGNLPQLKAHSDVKAVHHL